jgi:UDP-4-amino-4,6-dideoxy-N-acetyl-beta-L-altrosamine N-acetyltransferase
VELLRAATEKERDLIRRWRNHPRVRESSFVTRPIEAEEHLGWWEGVREGRRQVLIFERAGIPAGVVQFGDIDRSESSAVWGFYLDIEGLGKELLPAWMELEGEALRYAFEVLGLQILRGETLVANTPVRALHKRFGFTEVGALTRADKPAVAIELDAARWRTLNGL